jgi:hypothetical protein
MKPPERQPLLLLFSGVSFLTDWLRNNRGRRSCICPDRWPEFSRTSRSSRFGFGRGVISQTRAFSRGLLRSWAQEDHSMMTIVLWASLAVGGDPLKEPAPKDFPKFLDQCLDEFTKQQKTYARKWGIDDCERWDVDQAKGTITFTNTKKGHKKLVGKVQIIGSFNSDDDTWLWGWANKTVDDELKKDALKLKAYGEKNKLKKLTQEQWEGEINDAWKMTALAVKLLGAEGAYRGPAGKLYVFMVIRDLKVPKE